MNLGRRDISEIASHGTADFVADTMSKAGLDPVSMGDLLNIHPGTIRQWLEGREIRMGCAHALLYLLWKNPSQMLDLLASYRQDRPREPWPRKIASIEKSLELGPTDLADLLQIHHQVLSEIQAGEKTPVGCATVLLDLFFLEPELMASLLSVPEAPVAPWGRRRLQELLYGLHLSTHDLSDLLGVGSASVRLWLRGASGPGSCTALLLDLLESFPETILRLLGRVEPEDPSTWDGAHVRAVRDALEISITDLSALLGVDPHTIHHWEEEGLSDRTSCPMIVYQLLESRPDAILPLLSKLRI